MIGSALEAERAHLAGLLEAGHDYETDYARVAEHFNALHALIPHLYGYANRLIVYCREALDVLPVHGDFADEFLAITRTPEFLGVPGTYNPPPPTADD